MENSNRKHNKGKLQVTLSVPKKGEIIIYICTVTSFLCIKMLNHNN